jgi:hypothetical protein
MDNTVQNEELQIWGENEIAHMYRPAKKCMSLTDASEAKFY